MSIKEPIDKLVSVKGVCGFSSLRCDECPLDPICDEDTTPEKVYEYALKIMEDEYNISPLIFDMSL